jgi:radical SAM protein with 4Fe4S-binding SPASM domain
MKSREPDSINFHKPGILPKLIPIVQHLTLRRALNATLVWLSFYVSKFLQRPIHWGFPIAVSIEPTTACNLQCPECPSGLRSFTRATGRITKETFEKIVDQVFSKTLFLTLYFQGEPFIHKDLLDLVRIAKRRRLFVSTSTNGHFLDDENARRTVESGIDRIIVSIDGASQEIYEQYRVGGDLNKVLQGTRNLVEWKKKLRSKVPEIVFQFLVVKPNEHQLDMIYQLGRDMGVDDVRFKTAQIYDFENGGPLMPENQNYSRYIKSADGKYKLKNSLPDHCWKMWNSCVFTWDGKVLPCCFDKDAKHSLGTIREKGFQEIWSGSSYNNFRRQVLTSRKSIDICSNCSEGTRVWI